jgi:hypothetical protein
MQVALHIKILRPSPDTGPNSGQSEKDLMSCRSTSFTAAHEAIFGNPTDIATAYDHGPEESSWIRNGYPGTTNDPEKFASNRDSLPHEPERALSGDGVRCWALIPGVIGDEGHLLSAREKLKASGQVMAANLQSFQYSS